MEKQFALNEKLANAILQYLARKPYEEVAALIAALMQLKEAAPQPPALVKVPPEVK